jgi:hypothetical protein
MKKRFMISMIRYASIVFITGSYLLINSAIAQNDKSDSIDFNGGIDLMSRYVWRGLDFGNCPSIQPYVEADYKGYKLGAWGAYKTTGQGWQETDLYLTKSFEHVTFAVWDYYSYNDTVGGDFFNIKKETTPHMLELQVILNGGEKLPLKLLGSWFFYGAAPEKSFYVELSYSTELANGNSLDFFCGMTPQKGYYASKTAVVNLGLKYAKSVQVTEKFSLPVQISLVMNPDQKQLYLVAGISL